MKYETIKICEMYICITDKCFMNTCIKINTLKLFFSNLNDYYLYYLISKKKNKSILVTISTKKQFIQFFIMYI